MKVLDEVTRERERQDARWGQQDHDPTMWLMILLEEVGEAAKALVEHLDPLSYSYRAELIQVAAVAVAAIESFDRKDGVRT